MIKKLFLISALLQIAFGTLEYSNEVDEDKSKKIEVPAKSSLSENIEKPMKSSVDQQIAEFLKEENPTKNGLIEILKQIYKFINRLVLKNLKKSTNDSQPFFRDNLSALSRTKRFAERFAKEFYRTSTSHDDDIEYHFQNRYFHGRRRIAQKCRFPGGSSTYSRKFTRENRSYPIRLGEKPHIKILGESEFSIELGYKGLHVIHVLLDDNQQSISQITFECADNLN